MTDQTQTPRAQARGYSWPAFEPGHTKSLTHGATSPRTFGPIAERIEAELLKVSPWLGVPSFGPTLRRMAVVEAQAAVLRDWLDVNGLLDADGVPRPAVAYLERLESRATSLARETGMTPAGWASLTRSMTTTPDGKVETLEALADVGRSMLDATAQEVAGEISTGSLAPEPVAEPDGPDLTDTHDTPSDAPRASQREIY